MSSKDTNKLVETMVKETEGRIEATKGMLERGRILERYQRRQVLGGNNEAEIALGKIQGEIKNMESSIKEYEKFIAFLAEIAKE